MGNSKPDNSDACSRPNCQNHCTKSCDVAGVTANTGLGTKQSPSFKLIGLLTGQIRCCLGWISAKCWPLLSSKRNNLSSRCCNCKITETNLLSWTSVISAVGALALVAKLVVVGVSAVATSVGLSIVRAVWIGSTVWLDVWFDGSRVALGLARLFSAVWTRCDNCAGSVAKNLIWLNNQAFKGSRSLRGKTNWLCCRLPWSVWLREIYSVDASVRLSNSRFTLSDSLNSLLTEVTHR